MEPIRILLNRRIAGNYAFFCPETGLHLGVTSPIGFTTRLSSSILRGLRGGTLIDVDKRIDIEKGIILEEAIPAVSHPQKEAVKETKEKPQEVASQEEVTDEQEEPKQAPKRSKKASAEKAK